MRFSKNSILRKKPLTLLVAMVTRRAEVRKRAALKIVLCQNARNTKIATFRKSHQISIERPTLLKSALHYKKEADLSLAKVL